VIVRDRSKERRRRRRRHKNARGDGRVAHQRLHFHAPVAPVAVRADV